MMRLLKDNATGLPVLIYLGEKFINEADLKNKIGIVLGQRRNRHEKKQR